MLKYAYLFTLFVVLVVSEPDLNTRASVRNRIARAKSSVEQNTTHVLAGNYGIDISGQMCDGADWNSAQDFPCFFGKGKNFAIIETIQGGYGYTSSIKYCATQAVAAGMDVSVYAFMCPNCRGNTPAYDVAYNVVKRLQGDSVAFTYFYVDVEQCTGCWNGAAENVAYLKEMVRGATTAGAKVAMYSSAYEWGQVCGSDTSFSDLPLWYAHYDAVAGFSDFSPFGGWTSPHMKQYNDHSDVGCYTGVDVNWYP